MGNTTRATEARRLKFTDELLANVRWRFEHTDEQLSTMAADLGCCSETVRNIAKRENWVRYEPPPRDLIPAAKLQAKAEKLVYPPKLAEQAKADRAPSSPLIPAQAGIQGQDGEAGELSPGSPLPAFADATAGSYIGPSKQLCEDGSRGRAETEETPTPDPPSLHFGGRVSKPAIALATAGDPSPPFAAQMGGGEEVAETADALHAAVVKELADFKAERAQLKGQPLGFLERERAARTLAGLTRTLHTLQALLRGVLLSESHTDNDYDDMPADLDEFRRELARRIRIFVEGRRARSGAGAVSGDDAGAAGA